MRRSKIRATSQLKASLFLAICATDDGIKVSRQKVIRADADSANLFSYRALALQKTPQPSS